MITIDVNVTEEDIMNGVECDAFSCPIGLAARRSFGASYSILVDPKSMLMIDAGGCRFGGMLPMRAQSFIYSFDNGMYVGPIRFVMDLDEMEEF